MTVFTVTDDPGDPDPAHRARALATAALVCVACGEPIGFDRGFVVAGGRGDLAHVGCRVATLPAATWADLGQRVGRFVGALERDLGPTWEVALTWNVPERIVSVHIRPAGLE